MNATSSWAYDSEIRVTTGQVASFAKPFPFLRSRRLRFGFGLVGWSSVASLGVGVGVASGTDAGAAGGDGERRLEGRDGERCLGGEATGWPLMSSSHVEVVISSRRSWPGLVVGVGSVCGGNSIVKYCWMMGLSFFPLWKV